MKIETITSIMLFPYYVTYVFSFIEKKTVPIWNINIYQHKMGPGLGKTPSRTDRVKSHETW